MLLVVVVVVPARTFFSLFKIFFFEIDSRLLFTQINAFDWLLLTNLFFLKKHS